MTKNRKINKKLRDPCISSAAHAAVRVLEDNQIRCVIVDKLAAQIHGSSKVPSKVSIAVLPRVDDTPLQYAFVVQTLCSAPGGVFREESGTLKYCDPLADPQAPKKSRICPVTLTILNCVPPGYKEAEIKRMTGLPVIDILPLLVDYSRIIIQARDERRAAGQSGDKLLHKGMRSATNALLEAAERTVLTVIDDTAFNTQAVSAFVEVSKLSEALSNGLRPAIRFCQTQLNDAALDAILANELDLIDARYHAQRLDGADDSEDDDDD